MFWGCGVKFFVAFLGVLVATAYCTLLERKLLAGAQRRKGPNKISWKGAAQPLADALKLLNKERVVPSRATKSVFLWAPCFALCASFRR